MIRNIWLNQIWIVSHYPKLQNVLWYKKCSLNELVHILLTGASHLERIGEAVHWLDLNIYEIMTTRTEHE